MELNAYNRDKSYFLVEESISKLEGWLKRYGWKGYDPFDVLGTPFFLKIQSLRVKSYLLNKVLMPVVGAPSLFPLLTRRILKVEKTHNAMAAGLLARGYLNLYQANGDSVYLKTALNYLSWLEEHYSRGYSGLCWGYPFNWQSKIIIPKGTPSGVVTSIVVQAFLDAYEITKEKKFKKIAVNSIRFFLNDLKIMFVDDEKLCFSYTPLDDFKVHNANLWVASTLARTVSVVNIKNYKKLILNAVNFTLSDQRPDGGFYYWETSYAQANGIRNSIDNYHTGYVIEALADIIKYTNCDFYVKNSLIKAFQYYRNNLIVNDTKPLHTPTFKYSLNPVKSIILDINDCSETILVFIKMFHSKLVSETEPSLNTAVWSIKKMQGKDEHFYYRIYRWGIDKSPYIRWNQAWMFFALTELLKTMNENSGSRQEILN